MGQGLSTWVPRPKPGELGLGSLGPECIRTPFFGDRLSHAPGMEKARPTYRDWSPGKESQRLKDGRNLETSKIIFSYNLAASDPERAKGWSRVPQKLGMSQESTWCPVLTPTSLVQPTHVNTET